MGTPDVFVKKLNEVYIQLVCEPHIRKELSAAYEFFVPGYTFIPAYKNRFWDGKARLLNAQTGVIYGGLLESVIEQCNARDYNVEIDDKLNVFDKSIPDTAGFDLASLFNAKFIPKDYQNVAVVYALQRKKALLLSPTASGKSFIIYLIARHIVDNLKKRVLIVVPNISLTSQLALDFKDYNNGTDLDIHKISAGITKQSDSAITITTWQSMMKVSKEYLAQFDCVMVDEAHLAKATSITKLLEKMPECQWRLGFTGTIDDSGPVNKLTLEGLFGTVKYVTRTHELIEQKTLSDFEIKVLVLQHEKQKKPATYQDEIDVLVSSDERNKYIANLACNLKGNTLVLFNFVERHGIPLYELIKSKTNKQVYFISGMIGDAERQEIRKNLEKSNDCILVASFGTTSTGVNIVSLDNLIMAHPTKSKIRNLQSIGRILRKNGDNKAQLFDIVDKFGKSKNYSIKHFEERHKQYVTENFKYRIYNIDLKKEMKDG
jgi:superfamily II DNA or RNA helicase